MNLLFKAFLLLWILSFGGCRQETPLPQPGKPKIMMIGDVELRARMTRDGSPFSSQEDIGLVVLLNNKGNQKLSLPYLPEHPKTFEFKNHITGKETRIVDDAKPKPGVFRPTNPTAIVEPGLHAEWNLDLKRAFGIFHHGKYSVRLLVESPSLSFSTDWLDFEVEGMTVSNQHSVLDPEGEAVLYHKTWRDDGGKKPRILFRTTDVAGHEEEIYYTKVIGEADLNSEPKASHAVSGPTLDFTWIGWTTSQNINLALNRGIISKTFIYPLPQGADWKLTGPLIHSGKGGSPNSGAGTMIVSGVLLGSNPAGATLQAFQAADSNRISWLPSVQLPQGEIVASHVIGFNPSKRYIFTVRRVDTGLVLESFEWEDSKAIGIRTYLGSIPEPVKAQISFDAVVSGREIKWGLVQVLPGESLHSNTIRYWSHKFNSAENRPGAALPKSSDWKGQGGPIQIQLKFDGKGSPWLLHRDVHGAWVQSEIWNEPLKVETPRGSRFERLFFKHGSQPGVSFLDPDSGFKSLPVKIPHGEGERTVED